MSAAVTTAHLATAGRIIGENSTYTPDCGRVLYNEAQESIAQALADLESAAYARGLADGSERERAAAADYVYAQLGDDAQETADDIRAGEHLEKSE